MAFGDVSANAWMGSLQPRRFAFRTSQRAPRVRSGYGVDTTGIVSSFGEVEGEAGGWRELRGSGGYFPWQDCVQIVLKAERRCRAATVVPRHKPERSKGKNWSGREDSNLRPLGPEAAQEMRNPQDFVHTAPHGALGVLTSNSTAGPDSTSPVPISRPLVETTSTGDFRAGGSESKSNTLNGQNVRSPEFPRSFCGG